MNRFKLPSVYTRQHIVVRLIPFLLLYCAISLGLAPDGFAGDESRYIGYAGNLSRGFYSPPAPDIALWCGPGYPLLITPLVFLNAPFAAIRLLNALLLFVSLILIHHSIRHYLDSVPAFRWTVMIGLYYPIYHTLPLMHTEALAWFLISLLIFLMAKLFTGQKRQSGILVLAGLVLALLALTKVIFGYVIVFMIIAAIAGLAFRTSSRMAAKSLPVFVIAFAFCLPYLFYTYKLTDKPFYWASSGGMSLYTMSTPYANEYGDWRNSEKLIQEDNHREFMESIQGLSTLQRDEAFRKAALENIRKHPRKYVMNWFSNVGRLLFHYPWSYKLQSPETFFILIPNMFVLVFLVLSLGTGLRYYRRIPPEIVVLLLFMLAYLFGSSLLSAYRRMFIITMPFWVVYISFILGRVVRLSIREETSPGDESRQ